MASEIELARIAQVMNTLRTQWPVQSCLTTLRKHAHHPLADLAVAAVAVAVDERNATPAALGMAGPWWNLGRAEPTSQPPNVTAVLDRIEPAAFVPTSVGVPLLRAALNNRSA